MSVAKQRNLLLAATLFFGVGGAFAQGPAVKAQVIIESPKRGSHGSPQDVNAVIWLTPVKGLVRPLPRAQDSVARPQLVQKNKQFVSHVIAVEVGSVVDFPNHDPFFHNVFSLFNGKRFDLGLYEAGSTRSVHFDRAGICYIFCNIHPQMSAIVVVVDTPYFAVSNRKGDVVIPDVPAGQYKLNLWEEHCSPENLKEASREVTIGTDATSLETIRLERSKELVMAHPNKYGRKYDPQVFSSPIYSQP
jgi:plastocyanin